jgi:hypothetical protein
LGVVLSVVEGAVNEVVWVLWLWFFPFGATMDTKISTLAITPFHATHAACEADKLELIPKLAALWPDEKANVSKIEVHCVPRQRS